MAIRANNEERDFGAAASDFERRRLTARLAGVFDHVTAKAGGADNSAPEQVLRFAP